MGVGLPQRGKFIEQYRRLEDKIPRGRKTLRGGVAGWAAWIRVVQVLDFMGQKFPFMMHQRSSLQIKTGYHHSHGANIQL
jgi:hypothetical protein